ncbi:hypothetical protein ASPSYDRAFT_93218 [Aspergillus sydowii CBS 593.65]|uniref:Uncharacterized protein n=1 Tax=Aspergillus sydowii CBS 593.65 TaxID=1036612 RepID=A0A1L9T724_9EURO|nr:uncharacterized protein ASPSYDRAFT_93218 [Aspergillus sydowii CBS 593.65]OJJ55208.1 hypothetical protein ASPSYDRAFT_93218 [Aspergillus sydowii CBS 593.65]
MEQARNNRRIDPWSQSLVGLCIGIPSGEPYNDSWGIIQKTTFQIAVSSHNHDDPDFTLYDSEVHYRAIPTSIHAPYGPYPWKVAIIPEELKIPYETSFVSFTEIQK